jgi:tetratricopeptide (TPR) repeat protein
MRATPHPIAGQTRRLAILFVIGAALGCTEAPDPEPPPPDPRREAVVRFWQLYDQATSRRIGGDHEGAARAYENALDLDPRHEESLYYLGQCRRQLGEAVAARETFDRLLAVNPSSARGHLALGGLLAAPDEGILDLDTAEAHLRRAHEINAEETGPLVRLGEILLARRDYAGAREQLEAALRSNPRSVEAAFLVGYILWEEGDREGALSFYQRAIGAARARAPVKGVLGEGDRRPSEPVDGTASPLSPPPSPMGKTLFGAFSDPLRAASSAHVGEGGRADLDGIYSPVREFAQALSDR